MAKEYFRVMSWITLLCIPVIQALCYFGREPIIAVFSEDEAVRQLAESCFYIIILATIPDIIQGSLQGVIRALDVQKRASYYAMASFYIGAIPLAIVFTFVCDMGVAGLWAAMAIGISLQAVSYTHLVLNTNW